MGRERGFAESRLYSFVRIRQNRIAVVMMALISSFAVSPVFAQSVQGISADQLMKLQSQRSQNAGAPVVVSPTTERSDVQVSPATDTSPSQLSDVGGQSSALKIGGQSSRNGQVVPAASSGSVDAFPSRLEQILSERVGQRLEQFGYKQLGVGKSVVLSQSGGLQDDYILGPGDEIVVSLRGQENNEYRTTVNRDGRVILPRVSPVAAGGRSFGEFRRDLQDAIKRAFVSTDAYVSVGQVRQINIMVSGEVVEPGTRTLNGLASVVDAILTSGGIRKSGSLRDVRIIRGGKVLSVDLYAVLTDIGHARHMALADGDRVIVPPIGGTIAVTGDVRRPGIYELPKGRGVVSLNEAVSLAAKTTVPGVYRMSLMRQMSDGVRRMVDVTGQGATAIKEGEVLIIKAAVDVTHNEVTLKGAVQTPGVFALGKYKTLRDVLGSNDTFSPGAYMLFGYIDRIDAATHQHGVVAFSPLQVVRGTSNIDLQTDDVVTILSRRDMQSYFKRVQGKKTKLKDDDGSKKPSSDGGPSTAQDPSLTSNLAVTSTQSLDVSSDGDISVSETGDTVAQGVGLPGDSADADADSGAGTGTGNGGGLLGRTIMDYRIAVAGAVNDPGLLLVAPNTAFRDIIQAAGGFKTDSDLTDIEITSTVFDNARGVANTLRRNVSVLSPEDMAKVTVSPKDDIIVHKVFTNRDYGSVTLSGQVRYPGVYSILRGERLSSVLIRAGGLTQDAYPYGAVFTRKSLRVMEIAAHERQAQQIENLLIGAMSRRAKDSQMSAESFTAVQSFVTQLRTTPSVGRMAVVADPALIAANPAEDPLLENGDRLLIPVRPFTVSVAGEVLQPNNVPYKSGLSARDYIAQAGGFSQTADDSEVFVVLPNGSAFREGGSWFGFGKKDIPPGSTVFVGRDISGYDLRQGVLDVSTVLASLATTIASLAVLNK